MNPERFKALFPRACPICGTLFVAAPSRNQKYCSPRCAYNDKERCERIASKQRKVREQRQCIECGSVFSLKPHGSPDAKCCSSVCASRNTGRKTISRIRRSVPRTRFLEKKCLTCGVKFSSWQSNERKYCSTKCANDNTDTKLRRVASWSSNGQKMTYSRCQRQWVELGERRFFAKSKWEAYYGIFLEWERKNLRIKDWKYEPERFWFTGIKRGTMSYLPDFEVIENDGSKTYREVKGWMDKKSATRLKRMKKYHPDIAIDVIEKPWFKNNKMLLSVITLEHLRKDISE